MHRRLALALLAAAAVAGCSSSSSGGSNTAATSPVVTPSVSTSPSTSGSPTASSSSTPTPSFSTTVKASTSCKTSGLSMTVGQGQGAAGSTIIPLVFMNTSHRPCTMYGYPGVSFLDSSQQQIGASATRSGGDEAVVTLAPGMTANAQLQVPDPGNFSPAACKQATSAFIRAYPPGETHYVETSERIAVCTTAAGASMVRPVTPGSGG